MQKIKSIKAGIISDSRNVPTLSVVVTTESGVVGVCMVPSGASTGKYEAYELRDDGTSHGGVTKAAEIVNTVIGEALVGKDVTSQRDIDNLMVALDGTENKSKLGGNSILGVSVACAKAAAKAEGKEFYEYMRRLSEETAAKSCPRLYFNLINGGKHAKTKLVFQEYHIVPMVDSVGESLQIAEIVQTELGKIIIERYGNVEIGDEGGYAVPTEDVFEPLKLLTLAVAKCSLSDKIMFAMDVAASSFYKDVTKLYTIGESGYTKDDLKNIYIKMVSDFPIISIEDPYQEEDFDGFADLQLALPSLIIIGDDLTVTNTKRVQKALENKSITGLLVKPNQIGTLTETIDTISFAQKNGVKCVVSHRSGETMDDMIADIVTAFNCFGMKSGARGPKEREIKYARLAEIQTN